MNPQLWTQLQNNGPAVQAAIDPLKGRDNGVFETDQDALAGMRRQVLGSFRPRGAEYVKESEVDDLRKGILLSRSMKEISFRNVDSAAQKIIFQYYLLQQGG